MQQVRNRHEIEAVVLERKIARIRAQKLPAVRKPSGVREHLLRAVDADCELRWLGSLRQPLEHSGRPRSQVERPIEAPRRRQGNGLGERRPLQHHLPPVQRRNQAPARFIHTTYSITQRRAGCRYPCQREYDPTPELALEQAPGSVIVADKALWGAAFAPMLDAHGFPLRTPDRHRQSRPGTVAGRAAASDRERVLQPETPDAGAVIIDGDLDLKTASELDDAVSTQIANGHRHFVIDICDATLVSMATPIGQPRPTIEEAEVARAGRG